MYALSPQTHILIPCALFLYKIRQGYLCLEEIIIFYRREECINSEENVLSFDIALDHPHSKVGESIILSQNMFKSLKKALALLHVLFCLIKITELVVNYLEFLSPLFWAIRKQI